jgi:hypothetical protein
MEYLEIFATGNGDKVSESLAQIGLTVEDLKGLNADQAFNLIRNALSGVEDEALRVGIANEFFGDKIGTEILPMLSQEESAVNSLRQEVRELGIITNEQAAILVNSMILSIKLNKHLVVLLWTFPFKFYLSCKPCFKRLEMKSFRL